MFTPRHLRKKHAKKGAPKDKQKKLMFAKAARYSKRFVNLSANGCINAGKDYLDWCAAADRGGLRKSA